MTCCCNCKYSCTAVALVLSVIAGVAAAFLQIAGTITVTPVFLAVAFAVAVVYLAVLAATAVTRSAVRQCLCRVVNILLTGILGTVALAVVLLLVGVVATSVLSAVLVGLLAFFFTLTVAGTACYVRCLTGCED